MRCLIPNYDFICNECQAVFEDIQLTIANRDVPVNEPCPECGKTGGVERVIAAPQIGDAYRMGRSNLPSTWTDTLSKIKKRFPLSTMNIPKSGKREI